MAVSDSGREANKVGEADARPPRSVRALLTSATTI